MKKENTWKECIESASSVSVSPDKAKARSLRDTAVGRNHFLDNNNVDEDSANYIFEGYYSSALELLHALLLLRGYKVTNHICSGFYLRDVLNKKAVFRLFDDCRFKRNSLIYYGRTMDFNTAKDAIKKCKRLLKELSKILDDETKQD
ncbi:hypothetical protein HZB03_01195 [Candidatus Woesearchaeota archaeon]|nr:hypothetical protein [Candidatus Woesearchaeota archaeon]